MHSFSVLSFNDIQVAADHLKADFIKQAAVKENQVGLSLRLFWKIEGEPDGNYLWRVGKFKSFVPSMRRSDPVEKVGH
jgi:hypothetical protein